MTAPISASSRASAAAVEAQARVLQRRPPCGLPTPRRPRSACTASALAGRSPPPPASSCGEARGTPAHSTGMPSLRGDSRHRRAPTAWPGVWRTPTPETVEAASTRAASSHPGSSHPRRRAPPPASRQGPGAGLTRPRPRERGPAGRLGPCGSILAREKDCFCRPPAARGRATPSVRSGFFGVASGSRQGRDRATAPEPPWGSRGAFSVSQRPGPCPALSTGSLQTRSPRLTRGAASHGSPLRPDRGPRLS